MVGICFSLSSLPSVGRSRTSIHFLGAYDPLVDLGTLAGDFSYGTFINANNHVVGYSTIDKENHRIHAFLHDGKQMLDLGSLGGASLLSDRSFALGVNASDQVVGYSYLPSDRDVGLNPPIPAPRQVAFVLQRGTDGRLE